MTVPFPKGPLPGAALTILACTHLGQTVNTTRYKVRYTCCGREGPLLHRGIQRRVRFGVTLCKTCCQHGDEELLVAARRMRTTTAELAEQMEIDEEDALRRGLRRPYGFILPPWPVPEMLVSMYVRESGTSIQINADHRTAGAHNHENSNNEPFGLDGHHRLVVCS